MELFAVPTGCSGLRQWLVTRHGVVALSHYSVWPVGPFVGLLHLDFDVGCCDGAQMTASHRRAVMVVELSCIGVTASAQKSDKKERAGHNPKFTRDVHVLS